MIINDNNIMILEHFGPPATPQSLQYQSSRRQLNVRILCFLVTGVSGRPHVTLKPLSCSFGKMNSTLFK